MRTSIKVGKIIGIPIRLHFTFLLILPLFIISFAEAPKIRGLPTSFKEIESPLRYLFSTIATLLLFTSILLHELSHSYFAMKYGAKIESIVLFIFGGIAMMENMPKEPEKEWRIAIAGPMMSFFLAFSFISAYFVMENLTTLYRPIKILFFSIGFINMILGLFNLLPAFPMDGGRILRAFLARRWKFIKATRKSAQIGKLFAVAMGISGIVADPFMFILTGDVGMNLWTVLISFFLYIGASEEENATITYAALEGVKVRDIMRTEIKTISPDIPITDLMDKMLEDKTLEYVVSEEGEGYIRGFITFEQIREIPARRRETLKVGDVVKNLGIVVISAEAMAIEALKAMMKQRRNILAVEDEGALVGVITRRDLANFIEIMKEKKT
ncbi:MAG: site-2 protease family protein [Candidatus Methanospirareceae archaeon]